MSAISINLLYKKQLQETLFPYNHTEGLSQISSLEALYPLSYQVRMEQNRIKVIAIIRKPLFLGFIGEMPSSKLSPLCRLLAFVLQIEG